MNFEILSNEALISIENFKMVFQSIDANERFSALKIKRYIFFLIQRLIDQSQHNWSKPYI